MRTHQSCDAIMNHTAVKSSRIQRNRLNMIFRAKNPVFHEASQATLCGDVNDLKSTASVRGITETLQKNSCDHAHLITVYFQIGLFVTYGSSNQLLDVALL